MLAVQTHQMPPAFSARGHAHKRPLLVVVSDGEMQEELAKSVRALRSGSVRLSRAQTSHDLHFGAHGARCTLLIAAGGLWSRVYARVLDTNTNVFAEISDADARLLSQMTSPREIVGSRTGIRALGRAIANLTQPQDRTAPSWLDEALEALDCGVERPIQHIARTVRRDRVHFARAFAAHVGWRPTEYRALRRLGGALSALEDASMPLADVALDSGYAHQSHMNKDFREVLGRPPNALAPRAR